MFMEPDRDQLRAMAQKYKQSFKEYVQCWCKVAAQVVPPMGEKEMTKVFLKTLGPFYYEKMVASAPTDFIEMVCMGVRLEEAVREGRLTKYEGSSGTNKSSYGFSKNKEIKINVVAEERRIRPLRDVISINNMLPL